MDMTEQFLNEQTPQYDNFWKSLMAGETPQRTDTQPAPAQQAPQQEQRVPIGYGAEYGPPGSGDGIPRYADQQQSLMQTAMDPKVQEAARAELGPEKYAELEQQGAQAGQQQVQQNPQVQQKVRQGAQMATPRPVNEPDNWFMKQLYTQDSMNAYDKKIAAEQAAWDKKNANMQFNNAVDPSSPYSKFTGLSGDPGDLARAGYISSLDPKDARTTKIKNWEYGQNNPAFAAADAESEENYNAKIAQAEWYANQSPEGQQQARDSWRQQTYLNQGTQFAPTTGQGPTVPIYNQEAASEKAQGAGYGKAQSDYVTGYGSMRDAEDDFISNLRSTKALISEAGAKAGYKNTGWMSYLDQIPATDARSMTNLVETIQSRIAMDQMMNLKASSPTGSTGFGALSQKELSVLQDYLGKIDPKSSPAAVKKQLRRVFTMMDNMEKRYDKKRTRNDKKYNMFLKRAPEDTQQLYTPYGQAKKKNRFEGFSIVK